MNRPLFLLAVPLLTLSAQTRADFYSHKYGGIGYSDMQLQGFCSGATGFVQRFNIPGQTATSGACNDSGNGWKIYGGWHWTPSLAVEASYQQLTTSELNFRIDGGSGDYLTFEDEVETRLLNAFAVGHWPVAGGFSLFGKLGGGVWNAELSERQSGELFFIYQVGPDAFEPRLTEVSGRAGRNDNGFHWGYGAGISYSYGNDWTLRAEWETFRDISNDELRGGFDVEAATVGWSMHF